MKSRLVPRLMVLAALAAIFIATLTPYPGEVSETRLCLLCAPSSLADVIANLILFAPLGFALAWLGWPLRRAVTGAALLSGAIELSQLLFIAGRDASVSDVTMNTLGAALGVILLRGAGLALRTGPPRSLRFTAVLAGIAAVAIGKGDWMLMPTLPQTAYWGQWTADLDGDLDWYRGRVGSAEIGRLAVKSAQVDHSEAVRALLSRGAPVHVRGVAGPNPVRLAPFFSIYDEREQEILLIGPQGDDLVLRYHMRAADWYLDQPDFHLPHAFRGIRPGDSLDLTMWREPEGACLRLNAVHACGLAPTAGRAWSLLQYQEQFPEWLKRSLDGLWLALLALPAGLCAARLLDLGAGAGILALALALGPPLFGIGASPLGEWGAVAAGLVAGVMLRRAFLKLGLPA